MKTHAASRPAHLSAQRFFSTPPRPAACKRALILLCAALIVCAAGAPARAADKNKPVALKLKFTKGDVLTYAVKMDISGTLTMKGIAGYEEATGKSSLDVPVDMSIYTEMEMEAADVAPDGSATLTVTFTHMKMKNGTAVVFDTDGDEDSMPAGVGEFLETPITISLAPNGKILYSGFPNPDDLSPVLAEMKLDELFKQSWVTLPDKAVQAGDKWDYTYSMELPFAKKTKVKLKFDLEMLGFDTVKDMASAVIGIKYDDDLSKQVGRLEIPVPGDARGISAKIDKLSQKIEGKIYFAPGPGVLLGSHLEGEQRILGSFNMPGDNSHVTMDAEFTLAIDMDLL